MPNPARHWKRGDPVLAVVVEVLDEREVILRFGGGADEPQSEIMRVANESKRSLKVGDTIRMRVTAINPLSFQYVEEPSEQRRRGRLDVSV